MNFTRPRPTEPLPPLVQAYYENGTLEVSAVAFIDASQKNTIESIIVYYDDSTGNVPRLFILQLIMHLKQKHLNLCLSGKFYN